MAHDHLPSPATAHRGRLAAVFALTVAVLVVEVAGAALVVGSVAAVVRHESPAEPERETVP